MPRTRYAAATCCALAGVLLAGCGSADPDAGTNGVGRLAPAKIEAKTRAAAERATAVRLSGTVVSGGSTYHLDMRLKENGGTGEVTHGSSTFELLRVGKELYLKADSDFYRRHKPGSGAGSSANASSDAAAKLQGKYVKVPTDDPAYKQLRGFTDLGELLNGFLVLDGKLAEGHHGKVNGVRTVALDADGGRGGSVDVSLEGRPYPLRYTRAGGGGRLELTDYDKDFPLKVPADAVDYGSAVASAK
jgi:hypothetical protein